jgi:hypothetical protein
MFQRTLVCLRKARITIPQLSPSHTKARIYKWCVDASAKNKSMECYEPLFVLECSADLVTTGYRLAENHQPLMIVEAHDEGVLKLRGDIDTNEWYDVGHEIGEIDDGDDDEEDNAEWLWQAHYFTKEETDD